MMNGHEKSDPAIVAMKPANKAEGPSAARAVGEPYAAERVERRAGTKGKACHRRWSAYGKSQGKGRRRGSPRSSTTSTSTCSKRHSPHSRRTPPRVWID